MKGQGAIIGVGSMDYPPEFQGASEETLTRNAVSKVMTLTSTYDHRVIQGAQSGEFLKRVHALLLGEDGFYDEIFRSLRIPYEPIRWSKDVSASHDDDVSKQARILELIHAYRVRGHMMADTDPLEYKQRSHPDLEVESHGLTLWDLDREFATGSFGGRAPVHEDAQHPRHPARLLLPHRRHRVHAHPGPRAAPLDPAARRAAARRSRRARSSCGSCSSSTRPRPSRPSCRPSSSGQKRFSLEGGETTIPRRRRDLRGGRRGRRSTRSPSAWPTAAG